jgi:hypothetical protein
MDHAPDTHAHSHGHAHGHSHDDGHGHHHHGGSDYYIQQLLTIFICGAVGVVGVLMYFVAAGPGVTDDAGNPLTKLGVMLKNPMFQTSVLIGSITLLVVTVVRGIAVWKSVGANQHDHHHGHDHHHDHHHAHDHKPGEPCNHPSHAHGHDHGDHSADDHSHGNIYWRVVVLLFPVILFWPLGLPNGTFSLKHQLDRINGAEVGADLADVGDKGAAGDVSFETLAGAAYSEANRELFTGKTVTVKGQYKPLSATQFTLFFFKETCCAADQVPLKATCVVKREDENMLQEVVTEGGKQVTRRIPDGQKVTVTGRVQFTPDPNNPKEYLTVIRVDRGGIKKR